LAEPLVELLALVGLLVPELEGLLELLDFGGGAVGAGVVDQIGYAT
jgi:hypothetical protein